MPFQIWYYVARCTDPVSPILSHVSFFFFFLYQYLLSLKGRFVWIRSMHGSLLSIALLYCLQSFSLSQWDFDSVSKGSFVVNVGIIIVQYWHALGTTLLVAWVRRSRDREFWRAEIRPDSGAIKISIQSPDPASFRKEADTAVQQAIRGLIVPEPHYMNRPNKAYMTVWFAKPKG